MNLNLKYFLTALLFSSILIPSPKAEALYQNCDSMSGSLFYNGPGKINGEKVKVVGYSWAHGNCQRYNTKSGPVVLEQMLSCTDAEASRRDFSYAQCSLWVYSLNDKEVKLIKKIDTKDETGVTVKAKSGKIYTLTIYK